MIWCFEKNTKLPYRVPINDSKRTCDLLQLLLFVAVTMTLVTLRVVREKGSGLATIAKEQEDSRSDQQSRALSGLTTFPQNALKSL